MAVVVVCPKCSKQLRIAEHQVGKRAKCPHCKEVIALTPADAGPGNAAAEGGGERAEWRVMTGEQEEFGPVTKTELDAWMEDGRLDAECQVLKEGWDQWKWADEVYPLLAETDSPATPTLQMATSPTVPIHTGGGSLPGLGFPAASSPSLSSVSPASAPSVPAPPGTFASPASPASFHPPMAAGGASQSPADAAIPPGAEVCQGAIQALKQTQPWVLVFVVLSAIGLIFGGLALLIWTGISLFAFGIRGLGLAMFLGFPVLVQGLFAWLLLKYYLSIGEFLGLPSQANLQKSLEAQQQFWMASGIAVLAAIGLNAIIALVSFLFFGSLLG